MRTVFTLFAALLLPLSLAAQDFYASQDQTRTRDSVVVHLNAAVDSSLVDSYIFDAIPQTTPKGKRVVINQSPQMREALVRHINSNSKRTLQGYRVRIFFDNSQAARKLSEEAESQFRSRHPEVPSYRSYQTPFFKVTVGDFRTKSEAMELLSRIRQDFPAAFIVRENINYPVADRRNPLVRDTLRIPMGRVEDGDTPYLLGI